MTPTSRYARRAINEPRTSRASLPRSRLHQVADSSFDVDTEIELSDIARRFDSGEGRGRGTGGVFSWPAISSLNADASDKTSKRKLKRALTLQFANPAKPLGGEAPKVKDCPKDIEVVGRNGTAITWMEPIFTDNVKVTRISNNEVRARTRP